jgi:plastocyanin
VAWGRSVTNRWSGSKTISRAAPPALRLCLFAHIPLWTIYPNWGWGTDDSEQALSYVKRFGSVTVLNGHIHQIMQKVEGKVSFHAAMSTAFPQPAPGSAPSAGPLKVPADQLQKVLGITDVNYLVSGRSLAVVDSPLADSGSSVFRKSQRPRWSSTQVLREPPTIRSPNGENQGRKSNCKGNRAMKRNSVWVASFTASVIIAIVLLVAGSPTVTANDQPSAANAAVNIDNFVFGPQTITVPVGATVTWTNKDDIPHTSVSTEGIFKSKVLDTDEKFSYTFTKAGTYPYYCTIHPKMTGKVVVQ